MSSFISRRKRQKDEVLIGRSAIRDIELSLKAKGLLAILMSMDEDETMIMKYVRTLSKDGEDSHRTAMQELEKCGYMKKFRLINEKGQFCGWEYIIDDVVWVKEEDRKIHRNTKKSSTENPKPENPVLEQENPKPENPVSEKMTENDPKREKPVLENPVYNHKEIDDLKEMMIDIVYKKLVEEFPQLNIEDVERKYDYCIQYEPTNMENYLERAMRKDLQNGEQRKTKRVAATKKSKTANPIRTEILPDWYYEKDEEYTPPVLTDEQKAELEKKQQEVLEKLKKYKKAE